MKANGDISYMLGSPLRAFGADHGGGRGRRNAIERWDLSEGESEVIVARFHVSGPQGFGTVQVQAPANRRRGQFNYIIFEHPQTRKMIHVLDNRESISSEPSGRTAETTKTAGTAT